MRANYPGRCSCGCGVSFAPGTEIIGRRGRWMIKGHSIVKRVKKPLSLVDKWMAIGSK